MKIFRFLAALALAGAAALAGCAAPSGPDAAAQLMLQLQTARAAVDLIAAAHHVDPAKIAAVRAQADAAIALVASVGPVAGLADPKLAPAVAALTMLNTTIATANAAPPAVPASAPAGG